MIKGTDKKLFFKKEKRDSALTVRLPNSIVKKIKQISKKYNYSQSEVIETLVSVGWQEFEKNEQKNND
ncbi:MAG: hypothetical protein HOP07_10085 [Bacteriovoracaceae bacterium]|nr:hypothetical protein [Bacteriovoracaceae bacterium]